ncbi:mitochondrial translation GTPase Der (EngA) [Andalucia godoyi]|uniref:Mitochondrial translation GTPase Der (EngA) n=1 Tax=Andalucia godoyi TaxID=505711 RepID=A0A8K0AHQ5_ANDGO|nr:mitochondrial translation GTPase Der (EngA) [Andalucia godoyi]|eukprot:ANDGO_02924.mRNA.1 mitochondrial translation GTPase Der (EngA)
MTSLLRRLIPKLPRVTVVGRSNVGKSTLFNKLAQNGKFAIVDKTAGTTRDAKETGVSFGHLHFLLTDTPGADQPPNDVSFTTQQSIEDSAVALLVTDGRTGLLEEDREWAKYVQKKLAKKGSNKRGEMLWVVNKCENPQAVKMESSDTLIGGMQHPVPVFVSAEHALGITTDLFPCLREILDPSPGQQLTGDAKHRDIDVPLLDVDVSGPSDVSVQNPPKLSDESVVESLTDKDQSAAEKQSPIRLAIVGRPNSGKSTLLNQFLGEERVLAGPTPGLTRDAIEVPCVFEDPDKSFSTREIIAIDTAGLRRAAKRDGTRPAELADEDAKRAISYANLCVLMIDATEASKMHAPNALREDYTILSRVMEEGRAFVVAINKVDQVDPLVVKSITMYMEHFFGEGLPVVGISAKRGDGCLKLLRRAVRVYDRWNSRIPTAKLNRFVEAHRLETEGLVKYVTQARSRPPTFVAWCRTEPDESWQRWFAAKIRTEFDLFGVPFRVKYRAR